MPEFVARRCMGNKFWKRCSKIRQKLKKAKGREPLGIYKDILDQLARADDEVAEAVALEAEAEVAADLALVEADEGLVDDEVDMGDLLADVDEALGETKTELTPEEIAARRKAALKAKLRGASSATRGTLFIARAAGVDMHREGPWWSDCPTIKMKNLDDPERNGGAKVFISVETADALQQCKVSRDRAARIEDRQVSRQQQIEKLESNANKWGGGGVSKKVSQTPWGQLMHWLEKRKQRRLAAAKKKEEEERARYAQKRQAEMDRRAVAKHREAQRLEAIKEARAAKKAEIADFEIRARAATPSSPTRGAARKVDFAE